MKKSSNVINILLIILCVCIVAVGISAIFIFGFNNGNNQGFNSNNNSNNGVAEVIKEDGTDKLVEYRDANSENNEAIFTYQDVNEKAHQPFTPSLGEVNILVVPIEFDTTSIAFTKRGTVFREVAEIKPYTDSDLRAIEATFNGSRSDGTNSYWESVASFYEKSSYGKLNLNFEIADPYSPSMSAESFLKKEDLNSNSASGSIALIHEILNNGYQVDGIQYDLFDGNHNVVSKFDVNDDNYVDGIWLIYNSKNANFTSSNNQPFWAYTTNYIDEFSDGIVTGTRYANCALSFLFDGNANGEDAHTIIHETGHMLGLDDYYSYDNKSNYGYLGGIDMMDLNIGDHSSFSKYALGWTSPTVVYEKSSTITLKPFAESGESLIIPSSYYNDSAFSEYLLLEYKTPTGLNELDYDERYQNEYPNVFGSGLAIYHVDARLIKHEIRQNGVYFCTDYLDETLDEIPEITNGNSGEEVYLVANSNTPSYNSVSATYALVRLISKQRILYDQDEGISNVALTKRDLYQAEDECSLNNISRFFSYNSFNNGTSLSDLSIKVTSMDASGITLEINR